MGNSLNAEISDMEAKKVELKARFAVSTDIQERQNIIDEISRIDKKLPELLIQQEKEQAIEERVHNEAVTFAIEGVDFKELPSGLITIIEKVVKADRRRIYAEHAADLDKVEKERDEFKAAHESAVHEFEELQGDYKTCEQELKEQTAETFRLIAERDDARKNRDNAAQQLEEAKAEIARLESQIDDYQKAKVLGERQSQAVIDVTPNEAEDINDAIKTFLKSEDWGSIIKVVKPDESFELVKRDVFEKEWTAVTPPLLGGSETSAVPFQDKVAESVVEDGGLFVPQLPIIEPPSETEGPGAGLDGYLSVSEGNEQTIEERIEALEARVERIERETANSSRQIA